MRKETVKFLFVEKKMNLFFKNVSFTFIANFISAFVSVLVMFILPKCISVENYGYYQLYFFYIGYIGLFSLGWSDGLFLRYAGSYYHKLKRTLWGTQFKIFILTQFFFGMFFLFLACWGKFCVEKKYILCFIGISIVLSLPGFFLKFVLQCTNRIKEYAIATAVERIFFGLSIVILFFVEYDGFVFPIVGYLFGLVIALVYVLYECRDLLKTKFIPERKVFLEIKSNINCGCKLTFAFYAGLFTIGVIRWAIEKEWDISTFGKISLTLSVSNIILICIRSVTMVLLPTLRRIDGRKYASIYNDIKVILFALMFGGLLIYYPLNVFLTIWLPNYADSLKYMAILFPLCIFEGKLSLLVETYLKTMRLEKKILASNIATLIFSVIATFVSVFILENLTVAVMCILIIFAFRTTLGEYMLSKHLDINFYRNIFVEIALVAVFVCSSWLVGGIKGLLIYCGAYAVFLFVYHKKIATVIKERVLKKSSAEILSQK